MVRFVRLRFEIFQFQYGTIGTRQLVSLVEYEQISIPIRYDWNCDMKTQICDLIKFQFQLGTIGTRFQYGA